MTEHQIYEEIEAVFDNFNLCDASHIEGEDAADNALLLARVKQAFDATTTDHDKLRAQLKAAEERVETLEKELKEWKSHWEAWQEKHTPQ